MATTKLKVINFVVTGKGPFPLDMLRYDRCWPMTQDDVLHTPWTRNHGMEEREINLNGICAHPTIERWKSFGWVVTQIEGRPL